MEFKKMNNGNLIPVIGSGTNTFGKLNNEYMGEITYQIEDYISAIKNGYRLFDTATVYRNEAVLGKAIKESGIKRSDFFITTKIPGGDNHPKNREETVFHIENSLKYLETDYIDLYLIHHPWDDLENILEVWKVLEEYVAKGILKSIGVSNFSIRQLEYLLSKVSIKPTVNQFESHPEKWNQELLDYCLEHDIIPQAWGSIGKTDESTKEALTLIGNKYNKTFSQVILNYQISLGMIVIPKSHNDKRQKENLDILDFRLSLEEKDIISKL